MKNIEAQVTDLETSKALQEAGIEYETAFVWVKSKKHWILKLRSEIPNYIIKSMELIPAFTAGELMQLLPAYIDFKKGNYERNSFGELFVRKIEVHSKGVEKPHNEYCAFYRRIDYSKPFEQSKTLKEALAELCLWCKKEGYL